ncbi:hypothetical protein [Tropicimonas sediminicola]|uniref:Uncharacterized protein n=1 Tax=Tropicimonas sediminicola TaxID=1031541 RepID=A0A239M4I6_9RHOB|nr:hypothetical protein [Tropicimonas sediminicola]SNT37078.1 hypothetical protein SAMN05421757_11258 [Tropicimonas sediminicola]
MYEFLLMLSGFLLFAFLFSPAQWLLGWKANAGIIAVFRLFAKPVVMESDDRVLPFELAIQEVLAKRHARET